METQVIRYSVPTPPLRPESFCAMEMGSETTGDSSAATGISFASRIGAPMLTRTDWTSSLPSSVSPVYKVRYLTLPKLSTVISFSWVMPLS